jgi:hypothetical protein
MLKNIFKKVISSSLILIVLFSINSCKKNKIAKELDKELFEMAKVTSGFKWFKNSNSLLNKSSGSGHPQPFLRTRYNSVAASQLDSNGNIITGVNFPEGSLIVKELYDNSSNIERYAILYKKSDSEVADDKGWVWGYINADGSVAESSSKKGNSCISCHSQPENIDYMLMNKYFK